MCKHTLVLEPVFVRLNLVCNTGIELPYYSSGYRNVCINCGDSESLKTPEGKYPICESCIQSKQKPVNRPGAGGPPKK